MKISLRISVLIACGLSVNGCSTLQSWFPDKEKDYQFTTELPPLVIPPDLVQKPKLPMRSTAIQSVAPYASNTIETAKSVAPEIESVAINRPTLAEAETELSRNEIQISVTHENAPTLNLNVPSARAWRIVGKALSRRNIEVTHRNQESGQIHIQVADLKPKDAPEKSLWDNTISVFNPFSENEQSYVLQFRESNVKTAITVLNTELQPITDGADNKLLMVLFDAIKADLSK